MNDPYTSRPWTGPAPISADDTFLVLSGAPCTVHHPRDVSTHGRTTLLATYVDPARPDHPLLGVLDVQADDAPAASRTYGHAYPARHVAQGVLRGTSCPSRIMLDGGAGVLMTCEAMPELLRDLEALDLPATVQHRRVQAWQATLHRHERELALIRAHDQLSVPDVRRLFSGLCPARAGRWSLPRPHPQPVPAHALTEALVRGCEDHVLTAWVMRGETVLASLHGPVHPAHGTATVQAQLPPVRPGDKVLRLRVPADGPAAAPRALPRPDVYAVQ